MILFCMFLAALNALNKYYFCVYGAAILFLMTPNRKLRLNKSLLMLLVLSLSMLIFDPSMQDRILDMLKPFTYPLCYMMGMGLFSYRAKETADLQKEEARISTAIYVVAGGAFLHFLLNMIINWEATDRNVIDYWTKSEMSATGQAALACLAIAVSIAFLFSKVGKPKKIIAIVSLVLIVVYNLILAGRTIFVMMAIVAVAAFFYRGIANKVKISKAAIIILAIILILTVLYNQDAFGIKTSFETSNFYMRFYGGTYAQEMDEDSRMQYKLGYLTYFSDYLWGGEKIGDIVGHHAHDLYLDIHNEAGIFAFCAIVVYVIASLVRLVKCIRSNCFSSTTKMLVFCTYLACNIQFWIEPITKGMPWLLAVYCFIDGTVSYLLMQKQESLEMVRNTKLTQKNTDHQYGTEMQKS